MTSYLLKIRGGAEVDSSGKKAGKGALLFEEKSGTLGTSQDQYLFHEEKPVYSIEGNMTRPTHKGVGVSDEGVMYTLNTVEHHAVCYGITSYSSNSFKSDNPNSAIYEAEVAKTIDTNGGDPTMHQGGIAIVEQVGVDLYNQTLTGDVAKTLNAAATDADHIPCVIGLINSVGGHSEQSTSGEVSPTLKATHYKTPPVIALPNGGQSLNFINPVGIPSETGKYVVRRLTPTECCRLQGFPDGWGEIDHKEDFTDEEYKEWLEIRKTHAEIMGTQTKEWSKEQMLTWYNKLHTDGAEYKMWGNGIALPCALYVFEGLAEELRNNE